MRFVAASSFGVVFLAVFAVSSAVLFLVLERVSGLFWAFLGVYWEPSRLLCGALGGFLGTSWEPRNHLGIILGAPVVLLLGSSRSILFESVVFLLLGPLVVDFGSRR